MNTVATKVSDQTKMSSKEIAGLTEKRHADVIRDIRSIILAASKAESKGNADLRYKLDQGLTEVSCPITNRTSEFLMNRYVSELLVTGYDVVRRSAVISRWLELEEKQKEPQLPNFNNPVEAARAWADVKEESLRLEALSQEQNKKIEKDAPKVEYYEKVGDFSGLMTITDAIKRMNLGFGRNKAFNKMRNIGILQSSRASWNQPYQTFIDRGYFVVKQKTLISGMIVPVTLVTSKGHQWLFEALK